MLLIGIDPGVKTGVAVWDHRKQQFTHIRTESIVTALAFCLEQNERGGIEIWFEDARQRTWFDQAGREQLQGAGSIKRDCGIWQEFCEFYQIPYRAIKPAKGGTKWNADFFKRVTGWPERTSEHSRDAAVLVFQRKPTSMD